MNNLYKEFERLNMKSKMIIQVHDEIVCEVPNDEVLLNIISNSFLLVRGINKINKENNVR